MRRLVKACLINGGLLVLAIGSWAWFLYRPNSALHSPPLEVLSHELPRLSYGIRVWIERPNLPPTPGFLEIKAGQKIGLLELHQIDLQMQFYAAISLAMRVPETPKWKRIGYIEILGEAGQPPTKLDFFQTEDAGMGVQMGDKFYKLDPTSSKAFLEFFRKSSTEPELKQA